VVGDQRLVGDVDDEQLVVEALRIGEDEVVAVALGLGVVGAQALGPEVESIAGGDAPDDPVHHPRAGPTERRAGVLEEGQVRAGVPLLVGVEEVVDGGVVLVDGFLDQPEPENARVKVYVALRLAGDRGYVVDACCLCHRSPLYDPFRPRIILAPADHTATRPGQAKRHHVDRC
jgi:hypothetical protein